MPITVEQDSVKRTKIPSISLIIEWENAKLSELGRAFEMLGAMSAQVAALRERFDAPSELIVIYDRDVIDSDLVETALAEHINPQSGLVIRLAPMDDLDYYAQKNHGATLARNELLVFLDSDVVPEDGWLSALLEASLANPGGVVSGNTHLESDTFLGRTFGLFWFFPLRADGERVFEARAFFANSVVFPRELFLKYRYAPAGTVRGQCNMLADRLRGDGVPILRVEAARASHPAPNGALHVMRRALCEGHDAKMLDVLRDRKRLWGSPIAQSFARLARNIARVGKRTWLNRKAVGMSWIEVPFAIAIAAGYYTVYAVGELISIIAPTFIPNRLRV
jgi:glycosyltransferase involved in cell wall biosynthesis